MPKYLPNELPIGYVYFIRSGETEFVKIGCTTQLAKRLKKLQASNPLPLKLLCSFPSPRPFEDEKMFHQLFAPMRTTGEWFRISPQDMLDVHHFCANRMLWEYMHQMVDAGKTEEEARATAADLTDRAKRMAVDLGVDFGTGLQSLLDIKKDLVMP
jgi:hypothetical protein